MNAGVRRLPLNVGDEVLRIDGRWELRHPNPSAELGYDLAHVMHVARGRDRFPGPAYFVCSVCKETDVRQYDGEGQRFCPDVTAVREYEQQTAAARPA
ncbi:MAG: hypothetical protein ABSG25_09965 [Bryobacteraceae bacterium]